MRFRDLFSLSTRAFKTNTSRTVLTILGLGIGIGAVLFLVSLGYGLQNIILNKITTADSLLTLDVTVGSDLVALNKDTVASIQSMPEVVEISPVVSLSGQIANDTETADAIMFLTDKPFFRLSGLGLSAGKEFSSSDANEVIVSTAAAKIFGYDKADKIIGKTFKLNLFIPTASGDLQMTNLTNNYTVVGVVSGADSNMVYVPVATVGDIALPDYTDLKVKVKSTDELSPVRDRIVKQGLLVSSISDTIDQTNKIFKIIQIVLGVFGLIALVVSAIGMFNTMTVTLLERTKEIGIMRTIGASNLTIEILFLSEAILMGFFGGLSGVAIGVGGGSAINLILGFIAKRMGGQAVNLFEFPVWFLSFMIIFSAILGALTGFFPARNASKLNPLDAIRYS
jgi:putative ABC transport system permease protein